MIFYCILLRRLSATRVVLAAAITPATELASPVIGRTLFSRLGAGVWVASEAGTTGVGSGSGWAQVLALVLAQDLWCPRGAKKSNSKL